MEWIGNDASIEPGSLFWGFNGEWFYVCSVKAETFQPVRRLHSFPRSAAVCLSRSRLRSRPKGTRRFLELKHNIFEENLPGDTSGGREPSTTLVSQQNTPGDPSATSLPYIIITSSHNLRVGLHHSAIIQFPPLDAPRPAQRGLVWSGPALSLGSQPPHPPVPPVPPLSSPTKLFAEGLPLQSGQLVGLLGPWGLEIVKKMTLEGGDGGKSSRLDTSAAPLFVFPRPGERERRGQTPTSERRRKSVTERFQCTAPGGPWGPPTSARQALII
ncbi:unnamed protein product [Pleuronectes platessa]|uniref:Uncharacterized protein n=1 Tax=Pleuronectes platessa TaxID=8262 RepID=A0A9N7UCE1_PLEPL|nr:unnamed protein product [Pleuronectes platessa]